MVLVSGFAPSGSIAIDGSGSYDYSYVVDRDNQNLVSLATLSKDRSESESVYYPTFAKYQTYYLTPHYADAWVRAAMQAGNTFELKRGRADFGRTGFAGRTSE